MKDADRFLAPGEKKDLKELSQTMMGCYRNLSIEAHSQSKRGWKMKPKLHEIQHILEYATFINP
eukprot:2893476-Pyramimonas_sp.AAC.1